MAEAFGLAATIIGVAATGISVAETLVTFASSYGGSEAKISEIVDGLFVTSSTLRRLGRIVEDHKEYERDGNGDLARAISSCENTSKRVSLALGQAELESNGGEQKTQWMTKRWQKFKWAIGGEQGIDDLLAALARSKSNLELLINVLNYGILSNVVQSGSDLKPQLKDELDDLKSQIVLMTRMLGLVKLETDEKRKASQGPQRNKDESIPRQDSRVEGDKADPPLHLPFAMAAQDGNPFYDVTASDPNPSGREEGEDVPNKAREIVGDGPSNTQNEAGPARRRSSTPSLHPRRRSRSRSFPRPPLEPARYAYGAWTIRRKVITTYLIEKAPTSQPELEKIAGKDQSASNLSSLVALPPGARKAVNKFLDRRKYRGASLVVMEPLKKRWNPFVRRDQERPMALLVLRLQEDGVDDRRTGASSSYSAASSPSDRETVIIRQARSPPPRLGRAFERYDASIAVKAGEGRIETIVQSAEAAPLEMQADEVVVGLAPPSADEVLSTPEPPLPSQQEAEDLMAQYLAGFTAGPAEGGTKVGEEEKVASKEAINETDNVAGKGGQ